MEKVRVSESSPKSGPPYRELPAIPEPKARSKARYSVVLINEAGTSRQIELTPFKIRAGLVAAGGVVAIVIALAVIAIGSMAGESRESGETAALAKKISILEEELRKKELALTVQEKRLKEIHESPGLGSIAGSQEKDLGALTPHDTLTERLPGQTEGPLTSMPQSGAGDTTGSGSRVAASGPGSDVSPQVTEPGAPSSVEGQFSESAGNATAQAPATTRTAGLINFNAEDVTAIPEGPNKGQLRFRLIKDRSDVRFAGYLFVYVEMVDKNGETKLYAYPEQARRGEEDLPTDFREGESVNFKYRTDVYMDYEDTRGAASVAGVSILLYGKDGKIVFQRGFDRKDLKVVDTVDRNMKGAASTKGARRRAL